MVSELASWRDRVRLLEARLLEVTEQRNRAGVLISGFEAAARVQRERAERAEAALRAIYEDLRLVSIPAADRLSHDMPEKDKRAIVDSCKRARAVLGDPPTTGKADPD